MKRLRSPGKRVTSSTMSLKARHWVLADSLLTDKLWRFRSDFARMRNARECIFHELQAPLLKFWYDRGTQQL
jgi:hypothetical protein